MPEIQDNIYSVVYTFVYTTYIAHCSVYSVHFYHQNKCIEKHFFLWGVRGEGEVWNSYTYFENEEISSYMC